MSFERFFGFFAARGLPDAVQLLENTVAKPLAWCSQAVDIPLIWCQGTVLIQRLRTHVLGHSENSDGK